MIRPRIRAIQDLVCSLPARPSAELKRICRLMPDSEGRVGAAQLLDAQHETGLHDGDHSPYVADGDVRCAAAHA